MKRIFLLLTLSGFLFFLIFFPQTALSYAKTGLMLWFYTLLPSLLPFMILSGVLLHADSVSLPMIPGKELWKKLFCLSPQGAYALFLGIFCGYPMGAKITGDLYKEQKISKAEATYLLTFVNYPGPSFLSAYLCTGLWNRADLIFPTYAIIYTSGFLCAFLFSLPIRQSRIHHDTSDNLSDTSFDKKKETSASLPLGEILDVSIMNSFESISKLGGYIILFSILQGVLSQLLSFTGNGQYFLAGILEISTGTALLANTTLPFSLLYPLSLALTASGGLCVAAQTKSVLTGTDLSLKSYIKGKLCNFFLTFFLASLFIKILEVII